MTVRLAMLILLASAALAASLPRSRSAANAELYFISPKNGESVAGTFTVRFGLRGMGIAPAGVAMENTGHHHLLIDTTPLQFELPIPSDPKHVHFGKGQTEAEITLEPGVHHLQLLLGDHLHVPHDPPVLSARITITVT